MVRLFGIVVCDIHIQSRMGRLSKETNRKGMIPTEETDTVQSRFRNALFYAGPAIAYAVLIYFLSSLSSLPEEVPGFCGFDKIAHFFEYFVFGCLLYRWFSSTKHDCDRRSAFWITIAVGTIYALTDEWHQSFVPERDASLWDAIVDAIGIGTGAVTYDLMLRNLFPRMSR